MKKNIGIYDVDSKIPNLALMKISAYHKKKGDNVEHYLPLLADHYDKIYASKIFKFSDDSFLTDKMIIGGTGIDLQTNLPPEIEKLQPDYSLYDYPHNIGFTMRGCRLKCAFCVVPQKEGGPKPSNTIPEIWTQRTSDFVVLLDNDFFGNPLWKERVKEIQENKLKINFCQGLNIRNIKPDQAEALSNINFRTLSGKTKQVNFAWDDERHEKLIHKGIETLLKAGIKPYQMGFYVLIGFNSTHEQNIRRVKILKDYGCEPYVMPYNKNDNYQKRFARWVNHKAIFKAVEWEQYEDTKRR